MRVSSVSNLIGTVHGSIEAKKIEPLSHEGVIHQYLCRRDPGLKTFSIFKWIVKNLESAFECFYILVLAFKMSLSQLL